MIPDPGRASRAVEAIVQDASPFDAGRHPCPQGGEDRWSARWLMEQMGYPTWQHFEPVIERAKTAAHNEGFNVRTLFTVNREKTGGRPQTDYLVTRYAAYLIAMNGDPRKREVSAAQHYFAVKTREAELGAAVTLSGPELLARAVLEAQRMLAEKDAAIGELATKVEADAPKVEAYERFLEADGNYAVGTVAKMLGISQNKLFSELRARGVLIAKGSMRNTPYQRYMHHFDVKAFDFTRSDGTSGTSYTTRILPSGIKFVADRLDRPIVGIVE